ncbi:MAG TPA: argininosuccinate lyase [Ktedonobacteraceae bacterium]|nr:argininosuccinate lyase [Ktedonobacteraceae bacterium]
MVAQTGGTPFPDGREPGGQSSSVSVLGVGSRLASGPAPELVRTAFARELADQLPLFRGMSLADIAHTIALTETSVIPQIERAPLLKALLELHSWPADFVPVPENGDLYTNREAWLAAHTSAVGWLGTGRARRESTTTGFRLTLREKLLTFAGALIKTGFALLARAGEYQSALMADYTYLQPAQPTTFGHYLLNFVYPLLRDLERIQELYARTNLSPAGCGSVNGSRIPQTRARQAELLGFDGLIPHARDAMWQPDVATEMLSVIVMALVNLDRLAEDLQIFATAEFNLIELADEHSRASVIMPQKKNPYALNYVRGATNELAGMLQSVAMVGRTPSGQVDNRVFAYGDVPRALETASGVATLMAGVLSGMRFNAPVAEARLRNGFAAATDLAETITLETGLDFRTAHRIVGRMVRQAVQANRGMGDLTLEDLNAAAQTVLGHSLPFSEQTFGTALDPATAIAARRDIGCAAPEPLRAMLSECRTTLDWYATWCQQAMERIALAEERLLRQAEKLSRGEP